jgi:hypothetical protein
MKYAAIIFGVFFIWVNAAYGQGASPDKDAAIAELVYLAGEVKVERGGTLIPAHLNIPLLKGDVLKTGSNGAADLRLRDGSVIRVGSSVTLDVGQVALSSDPKSRLWLLTVWSKIQVLTGKAGASPGISFAAGVRGVEEEEMGAKLELEYVEEETDRLPPPEEIESAIIVLKRMAEENPERAEEALYLISLSYQKLGEIYQQRLREKYPQSNYIEGR